MRDDDLPGGQQIRQKIIEAREIANRKLGFAFFQIEPFKNGTAPFFACSTVFAVRAGWVSAVENRRTASDWSEMNSSFSEKAAGLVEYNRPAPLNL